MPTISPSRQTFDERLNQIRERGYEIMPSAQTAGVFNVSAPVLGPDGRAIAALTCPYIQLLNIPDAPGVDDARKMLVATAQKLSELAGRGCDSFQCSAPSLSEEDRMAVTPLIDTHLHLIDQSALVLSMVVGRPKR